MRDFSGRFAPGAKRDIDLQAVTPCMGHYVAQSVAFERDNFENRSGDQILRSVQAYLEFRAGSSWRNVVSSERWNPQRLEYLSAIRLIQSLRFCPPVNSSIPKRRVPYSQYRMTFAQIGAELGISCNDAWRTYRTALGKLQRNTPNALALLQLYAGELATVRERGRRI